MGGGVKDRPSPLHEPRARYAACHGDSFTGLARLVAEFQNSRKARYSGGQSNRSPGISSAESTERTSFPMSKNLPSSSVSGWVDWKVLPRTLRRTKSPLPLTHLNRNPSRRRKRSATHFPNGNERSTRREPPARNASPRSPKRLHASDGGVIGRAEARPYQSLTGAWTTATTRKATSQRRCDQAMMHQ